jgi:hypothetical protein
MAFKIRDASQPNFIATQVIGSGRKLRNYSIFFSDKGDLSGK